MGSIQHVFRFAAAVAFAAVLACPFARAAGPWESCNPTLAAISNSDELLGTQPDLNVRREALRQAGYTIRDQDIEDRNGRITMLARRSDGREVFIRLLPEGTDLARWRQIRDIGIAAHAKGVGPRVVELNEANGYYAVERAPGLMLIDYLQGNPARNIRPATPQQIAEVLALGEQALETLHREAGVAHLDVTPTNIIVDTSTSPPVVRFIDFEHSLYRSDSGRPELALHTIAGRMASLDQGDGEGRPYNGTPAYALPEIFRGRIREAADHHGLAMSVLGHLGFRPGELAKVFVVGMEVPTAQALIAKFPDQPGLRTVLTLMTHPAGREVSASGIPPGAPSYARLLALAAREANRDQPLSAQEKSELWTGIVQHLKGRDASMALHLALSDAGRWKTSCNTWTRSRAGGPRSRNVCGRGCKA